MFVLKESTKDEKPEIEIEAESNAEEINNNLKKEETELYKSPEKETVPEKRKTFISRFIGDKESSIPEIDRVQKSEPEEDEDASSYNSEIDSNLIDEIITYFIESTEDSKLLFDIQKECNEDKKEVKKKLLLKKAETQLKLRNVLKEDMKKYISALSKYLWGFHVLQELIDDPDIQDIKVLSYDQIITTSKGKENFSKIKFSNENDFDRFIDSLCVKNKINFSDINAVQTFPDKRSHPDFRLRISISSPYVNGVDNCYLHIRKHAKRKKTLDILIKEGLLTDEQADYLIDKVKRGSSFLFTGCGGSGKTTLYNALLEYVDCSGIIIDESEELFTTERKKLMFLHSVDKRGEGKVRYSLEDLSRFGLKTNQKMFGIGEITGNEAAYFMMASNTGHICWTSSHGSSAYEASDKLADYIVRATNYDITTVRKFLKNMDTVIFLENYKIKEITEVVGFNKNTGEIEYTKIF